MVEMADVLQLGAGLRNWGRWGADDQVGTLNFITPAKIVEAAGLVRQGKCFSLCIPFDERGPQAGGGRFNPLYFTRMDGGDDAIGAQDRIAGGARFQDDVIVMPLQAATQWDSLSHAWYGGQLYNGYPSTTVSSRGTRHNGIENTRDRFITRGVLLDIARSRGEKWLRPGYPITVADLEQCAAAENVTVGTGDVLLVRTGHQALCREQGSWQGYAGGDAAGLSLETCRWLHDREVAAVATDTWGMEVRPNEPPNSFQPLHMVLIRDMGMSVGEIFNLDGLGDDCASDGVWEFLFVGASLPFTGAAGSPVNPIAIK